MKKWLRNLLKGTSLSTALFIFQACYGMPPGYDPLEIGLVFQVVDSETDEPVKGAMLKAKEGNGEWMEVNYTDDWGVATYITFENEAVDFQIVADKYEVKDTTLSDLSPRSILIKVKKSE